MNPHIPGLDYFPGEVDVERTKRFHEATPGISMGAPSLDGKAVNIVDSTDPSIRKTITLDGSTNQRNVDQISRSGSKKVPIARNLKLNPITRDADQNYLARDPKTGELWELTTFRQPVKFLGMTIGSYKATKGAYWSTSKSWEEQRLSWKQQSSVIAGLPMQCYLFNPERLAGRLIYRGPVGFALPPECFMNGDQAATISDIDERLDYKEACVANGATYSDGYITDPSLPSVRMGELLTISEERANELLSKGVTEIGEGTRCIIGALRGPGAVPIMSGKAETMGLEWARSMKLVVKAGSLDGIAKSAWNGIEQIRCQDLEVRVNQVEL